MLVQSLPIAERIFHGRRLDFLALTRHEIKDFSPNAECLVISFTDPEKPPAEIFESEYLLDILRLKFDDADKTKQFKFAFQDSTDIFMTTSDAERILSFVKAYLSKLKLIICQCEQGLSRSPAIAGALAQILENDSRYFLQNYWTNLWVYNLILEQSNQTS